MLPSQVFAHGLQLAFGSLALAASARFFWPYGVENSADLGRTLRLEHTAYLSFCRTDDIANVHDCTKMDQICKGTFGQGKIAYEYEVKIV